MQYIYEPYDGDTQYQGAYGCYYLFNDVSVDGGKIDNVKCDGEEGVCWYVGDSVDDLTCNEEYTRIPKRR